MDIKEYLQQLHQPFEAIKVSYIYDFQELFEDEKKVKLYKSIGPLSKINANENINSAILQGDEMYVNTKKGKIRIYTLTGSLRKII